jgi:TRAP-type mannitol/chloroaromatic compound transport system substrate-binding protein
MKRREFLKTATLGVAAAGALVPSVTKASNQTFKWKMATSYPPKYPILGTGCEWLAKKIGIMSQGRLQIQVFAGGELIGPLEVFDAVNQGHAIQMGSTASYYYPGQIPVGQLFTAVPFGFTATEMYSWLYQGGGLDLYRKIFKKYNIYPVPHLNTMIQMAGWFRKEIKSVEDFKGLKIRIPGLGGKTLAKLGANIVLLPGSEIFTAFERGVLDSAEWAIPIFDQRFGLYQAAKNYYYPGWQEPQANVDLYINTKAWESLPPDLQAIVEAVCGEGLLRSFAEVIEMNATALKEMVEKNGVVVKRLPDDVIKAIHKAANEVLDEQAASDPDTKEVLASIRAFQQKIKYFREISEGAYMRAKEL